MLGLPADVVALQLRRYLRRYRHRVTDEEAAGLELVAIGVPILYVARRVHREPGAYRRFLRRVLLAMKERDGWAAWCDGDFIPSPQRPCGWCGRLFIARTSTQRYCHGVCGIAGRQHEAKVRRGATMTR